MLWRCHPVQLRFSRTWSRTIGKYTAWSLGERVRRCKIYSCNAAKTPALLCRTALKSGNLPHRFFSQRACARQPDAHRNEYDVTILHGDIIGVDVWLGPSPCPTDILHPARVVGFRCSVLDSQFCGTIMDDAIRCWVFWSSLCDGRGGINAVNGAHEVGFWIVQRAYPLVSLGPTCYSASNLAGRIVYRPLGWFACWPGARFGLLEMGDPIVAVHARHRGCSAAVQTEAPSLCYCATAGPHGS